MVPKLAKSVYLMRHLVVNSMKIWFSKRLLPFVLAAVRAAKSRKLAAKCAAAAKSRGNRKALAVLVLLAVQGHHMILKALHASFQACPPGKVLWGATALSSLVETGGMVFSVGVQVAEPVTLCEFCRPPV